MAKQPSRDDPSKPKAHGYAYKKQFYQSADVAADYDEHRFRTPKRQRRNARKWNAIQKALALTQDVKIDRRSALRHRPFHRQSRARGVPGRRQRHLDRDDAAGGETAHGAARQHRGLRARRRRGAAVRDEVGRLPDEHPLPVPRGQRDAPANAARVRPRVAQVGHRRLSSQIFLPLRRMESGEHARVSRSGRSSASR